MGWGPNGRAWGDDEFWMDVLIQGIGWLILVASILVSARFFYVQRQNEIADNKERIEQEKARERSQRQAELTNELLDLIRELNQLPLRRLTVLLFPTVYQLNVARISGRIGQLRAGIEDPHVGRFIEAVRDVIYLSASTEHRTGNKFVTTDTQVRQLWRQFDATADAEAALNVYLTHGEGLDMTWFDRFTQSRSAALR